MGYNLLINGGFIGVTTHLPFTNFLGYPRRRTTLKPPNPSNCHLRITPLVPRWNPNRQYDLSWLVNLPPCKVLPVRNKAINKALGNNSGSTLHGGPGWQAMTIGIRETCSTPWTSGSSKGNSLPAKKKNNDPTPGCQWPHKNKALQEGARDPSCKVVITPANPMKNHGCKWV